jgi:hypothetical protein
VNNIRIYLGDIECCGVHWIYLAQVKDKWKVLVNQVMNLGVKE